MMQRHIENYRDGFIISEGDFILCEVCRKNAVDIHHIEPRSRFGSKKKHEQDHPRNLIALCRDCHDRAHFIKKPYITKEELKRIHCAKIN